jgi:hypothetical protein
MSTDDQTGAAQPAPVVPPAGTYVVLRASYREMVIGEARGGVNEIEITWSDSSPSIMELEFLCRSLTGNLAADQAMHTPPPAEIPSDWS